MDIKSRPKNCMGRISNMDNRISFKGYKNVLNMPLIDPKDGLSSKGFRFIAEVTDDITPDLSDWKNFLKKFPNDSGDNFIKIDYITNAEAPTIVLNSVSLINCKQNFSVFEQIAKFCQSICTTLDHGKKMIYDENDINGVKHLFDCSLSVPDSELIELSEEELSMLKNPQEIKRIATTISHETMKKMAKCSEKTTQTITEPQIEIFSEGR